jgi:hypothetical protein
MMFYCLLSPSFSVVWYSSKSELVNTYLFNFKMQHIWMHDTFKDIWLTFIKIVSDRSCCLNLKKLEKQVSEGLPGFIYLGIYFFQRIYLFNEDLLGLISCISISAHPHSPSPHSPSRDFKMYEDLLKNPNKSQKSRSW